jgi:hypothetical protein
MQKLNEIIMRIQGDGYYEKQEIAKLKVQAIEDGENLLKKVKFY